MAIQVIINEQHTLSADQIQKLDAKFGVGSWSRLDVPADGWIASQIREVIKDLATPGNNTIIFASPIPLAIKLAFEAGIKTFVFHNDNRDKKELPNGKIIFTVAQTGWEIL
jgi:hypothetical protein